MDLLQQTELIFKDESYEIIGACMEVHNVLGYGFPEAVYQEALKLEFQYRNIPYASQQPVNIFYKGKKLKKGFVPDFICYNKIIIELKAIDILTNDNTSQVLDYLKATGLQLGMLVNFGTKKLQYKRFVL